MLILASVAASACDRRSTRLMPAAWRHRPLNTSAQKRLPNRIFGWVTEAFRQEMWSPRRTATGWPNARQARRSRTAFSLPNALQTRWSAASRYWPRPSKLLRPSPHHGITIRLFGDDWKPMWVITRAACPLNISGAVRAGVPHRSTGEHGRQPCFLWKAGC